MAAATNQLSLSTANSIRPRAIDTGSLDVADTTATAIREHDVKRSTLGVHRYTGSPNSTDAIHLAGVVNDAEVGPVLHIFTAEAIKSINLVSIGICRSRVVGVRDDIEIFIVRSGPWVSQIMVG